LLSEDVTYTDDLSLLSFDAVLPSSVCKQPELLTL
jgi:hypothetical protein